MSQAAVNDINHYVNFRIRLDYNEETKDVRALDYMPPRMTDTLNQILVDMILVSVLVYSPFTT